MRDYENICEMARQIGFSDFTALQRKSFQDKNFFDIGKWLFIVGATGSGKTLVALMSYFYEQSRLSKEGLKYKMLFSVPYRALASQKMEEIQNACELLGLDLKILQSTSEHTLDDDSILAGDADIVIIINEKVFMFAASDGNFLSRYNLLVFDEIALTQDPLRGVKTDFVLLKARKEKNLRVITLGTPFFNWSSYIKTFNFVTICEMQRPIEIKEIPIFESKLDINNLGKKQSLIDILKKHLQHDERIIIFINSRQIVQELSRALTRELKNCGAVKQWTTDEKCKDYILSKIRAIDETTLYGIMDLEDYSAFSYGITFHNANMPPSLRYFIERDFMDNNGHLKIICSTETLAYGINSNADVIIIPGMRKNEYSQDNFGKIHIKQRFILPNEYMNYAGRAGRLNPALSPAEQKVVGYVYPIMLKNHEGLWKRLLQEIENPELSISKFFDLDYDLQVFFVLSLFSAKITLTADEVVELLKQLPNSQKSFNKVESVNKHLQDLLKRRLIYVVNEDEEDEDDFIAEYKATDTGKKISGFVIKLSDFDKILSDISTYVTEYKIFEADIFYSIISSEGILISAKSIFGELTDRGKNSDSIFLQQTIPAMQKVFQKNRKKMSLELYAKIMKSIGSYERRFKLKNYFEIFHDKNFITHRIFATVLLWLYGECKPEILYNSFKIYYEQMRRMMEIVSYRLDMIRFSLSIAPGKNLNSSLRQEIGLERLNEIEAMLEKISADIMYQPSNELCNLLAIRHCDMHKIQKLKSVEAEYNRLMKISAGEKIPENYFQKLMRKMNYWPPTWRENFIKKFGGFLDEQR